MRKLGDWFWNLNALRRCCIEILLRIVILVFVVLVAHNTFYNDTGIYFKRAALISWDVLPYRDFLWEYPPLSSLPLLLVPFSGRKIFPFRILITVLMMAIEFLSLIVLRRAVSDGMRAITFIWTVTVVPLGAIAYFRLDFIPMFFATVALVGLISGRRYVGATVAGFAAKLWPIVFLVPMFLAGKWRQLFMTIGLSTALVGAWWAFSPSGFHDFLSFRQGDGFQVESIPGSIMLLFGEKSELGYGAVVVNAGEWQWLNSVLNGLFLLIPIAIVGFAWLRRKSHIDMVALLGALVTVALISQRLLSPQFLVWIAPFMALCWLTNKRIGYIYLAAVVLTDFVIQLYTAFINGNPFVVLPLIVRNGLLIWLTVEFLRQAFDSTPKLSMKQTGSQPEAVQAIAQSRP